LTKQTSKKNGGWLRHNWECGWKNVGGKWTILGMKGRKKQPQAISIEDRE